ncbi:MAG TPA: hypothetical protein VLC97_14235 [Rhodanobacteraceae bacterium]|nr:hypothetical protein [Rhodanobacteraceae bacterium]
MKSLLSAAVAAALSLSAAAQAGSLVDVSVIDRDTGSVLATHPHDGKLYIAGIPGHRYSVRLSNRTSARVLTVLSVDGVNAISGQTANPNQSGYVLDAWQSTEVEGWRKNMSEIAQFNFTALDNSYAARTGRPNNVGVIGVAVFREKPPVWRERDDRISMQEAESQPRSKDSAAAPSPAAPASAGAAQAAKSTNAPGGAARADSLAAQHPTPKPEESLGTGHGARESSYASYTTFERASSSPDEVDSVWYDSYRNLVARGVIPTPRPIAVEPQPFPNGGFAPDPAG